MEWELRWDGQALHLYTFFQAFFYIADDMVGKEVCLVLGVCNGGICSGGIFSSGISHTSECPQSWLQGLF